MVADYNWVILLWVWLVLDDVVLIIRRLILYSLGSVVTNTNRPIHITFESTELLVCLIVPLNQDFMCFLESPKLDWNLL